MGTAMALPMAAINVGASTMLSTRMGTRFPMYAMPVPALMMDWIPMGTASPTTATSVLGS
jgi:hypothetical protein